MEDKTKLESVDLGVWLHNIQLAFAVPDLFLLIKLEGKQNSNTIKLIAAAPDQKDLKFVVEETQPPYYMN